ncbi:MAG: sulfotransferase [Rudaea sp.]
MLTQEQRFAGLSPALEPQVIAIGQSYDEGQIDAAERGAIAALAIAPNHPEVLRLFGMIQFRRGRVEAAIDTLLKARGLRPQDAAIYSNLGSMYDAIKDYTRSNAAMKRACELDPTVPAFWFNYARRLFIDAQTEDAISAFQRVIELDPQHANARAMLANLLRADGKMELAAEEYRRIISDDPAHAGHAWWGLATLKPIGINGADISKLRGTLADSTIGTVDRIFASFALAMALESEKDYAGAFDHMRAGHALARRNEAYDANKYAAHIDEITSAFRPRPMPADPACGDEVIFIVSLPRSGSTLTEQILASHSQVEGGSELPDLAQIIMDESDRVRMAYPHWVKTHTPLQWHRLGQEYLRRTQRWRERRPRSTDKSPGNWQHIGAILTMLPNARIVVCRRDPLETCLACYRYMFVRQPYTHDFADLARHLQTFDRSVCQWKQMYPDRVREQIYEDLVADPEAQIRELLEFCNLSFEENCLNFHNTQRRVTTPSAAQVREPIRRDTARADKYGALLDPLRLALGMPAFADR